MTKLVVAIGGNALQPAGETADATAQRRRIEATASLLADVVAAGHDLVLTHGNGPQVGNILLQNEETRHLVPPMPLDVCGAESQALIGYLLAQALRNEFAHRKIDRDVACVVTQVLVHADDAAFANPTKPIGPYYLRDDEILVKKAKGWKMVYDQRGGWRRVVPSPRPVDVIEKDVKRAHLAAAVAGKAAMQIGRARARTGFPGSRRSRPADGQGPEAVVRGLLRIRLSDPVCPPGDPGPGRGDRQDPPSPKGRTHPRCRVRRRPPYDRARETRVSGDGLRPLAGTPRGGAQGGA